VTSIDGDDDEGIGELTVGANYDARRKEC